MYNSIMKRGAKEETMKVTTIRMPEALLKRVKIRAVEEGRSFQALLIAAVEDYLKTHRRQG